MIYVSVVSHESVGVVAFSLWAAFEEPHCRDRDCGSGSFGLPGNSISVVDPVPNVSHEFCDSERVKDCSGPNSYRARPTNGHLASIFVVN